MHAQRIIARWKSNHGGTQGVPSHALAGLHHSSWRVVSSLHIAASQAGHHSSLFHVEDGATSLPVSREPSSFLSLSPEVFILIITCSSAAYLPFLSRRKVRKTARWRRSCFHQPSQVYVSSQAVEAACWFSASFCNSFSPKVRAPTRPKAWRHWLPLPSAKPSKLTVSAGLVRLE